jgi:hypothetical protein
VRYDVTLPDLDAQRIRVDAQSRAALVEAAGQSLRESDADVRYADRAAALLERPSRPATRGPRSRRHRGAAAAAGVDVRLDRLTADRRGTSWSLTEPARLVYAGDRVDVDRLAWPAGSQKIDASRRRSRSATRRRAPCRRIGRCVSRSPTSTWPRSTASRRPAATSAAS